MGKRKSSLGKTPGLDFLTVIALIAAAIVSLFPVLWGLSTALKIRVELAIMVSAACSAASPS